MPDIMTDLLCPMTTIEFACLQFRQVFETIAWACMVANEEPLDPKQLTRRRERNPRFLFNYLERTVMPDCYPTPLTRVPLDQSDINPGDDISPRTDDDVVFPSGQLASEWALLSEDEWLTRAELTRLHGEMSKLLHIRNPMRGESLRADYYEKMIPVWWEKTTNLIALHRIALPGDDICIVQILSDGQIVIEDFCVVGAPDNERDLIVPIQRTERFH